MKALITNKNIVHWNGLNLYTIEGVFEIFDEVHLISSSIYDPELMDFTKEWKNSLKYINSLDCKVKIITDKKKLDSEYDLLVSFTMSESISESIKQIKFKKTVIFGHEAISNYATRNNSKKTQLRRSKRFYEEYKKFDYVFCISKISEKDLNKLYPELKTFYTPNIITKDQWKFTEEHNNSIVIFSSSPVDKNFYEIFRTLAKEKLDENYKIHVLGIDRELLMKDWTENKIARLKNFLYFLKATSLEKALGYLYISTDNLDKHKNFILHGRLEKEEYNKYLEQAKYVIAHTSADASSVSIAESIQTGKVCFSSKISSRKEEINYGYSVVCKKASEISKKIKYFDNNKDEYQKVVDKLKTYNYDKKYKKAKDNFIKNLRSVMELQRGS